MNFHQFLTILLARKRLALSILALTVLTTLLISLVMPKTYEATAKLVIDYKATDPVSGMNLPAQLMSGYMATQVDIIKSRHVVLKVVDALGLASDPAEIRAFNAASRRQGDIRGWLADRVSRKLDVKPSREGSTIDLSFESDDPDKAAAVANAFADAYIQTNLKLRIDPYKHASEMFSQQVGNLREDLVKAQQRLADFQHEHGMVSLDERLDVESARLSELASQLVLAQAQTFDSISKQREMYSGKRLDQLGTDVRNAKEREASIRAALERQKALVMQINQQRNQLGILQGDVATAQKVLDTTMQRFSETHMEGQADQSGVAVLDPATPPQKPSKPRILMNLLVSLFLGGMLAAGVALQAEMRDRRIHVPEDLSLELDLPVLGVIAVPKLQFKL